MKTAETGNQVIERISFLEKSNHQYHCLLEQKKIDCQLLEEENRQMKRQIDLLKRELSRLKAPNYLVAI
ncbi:hypothetical protein [Enterococcus wangshanyuanii]|uniref:Transposase n=1 Tax=Enterococcus wangshanyuanii TaxID=2005703 RepID=A0ABQ1PR10_9ENTE|nr:hypothetical protein [Enterococcus wangshanyuanii]GGD01618.1 hypothetical protein GCM10011573_34010 [Enterococcus wangshanyuanii]